jgi:hypothetical protein
MVVQLTPALQAAIDNCEQAAQRVTALEARMSKLRAVAISRPLELDYDEACRDWRAARQAWEHLYRAAGGNL